jgi:hypothetical protein
MRVLLMGEIYELRRLDGLECCDVQFMALIEAETA